MLLKNLQESSFYNLICKSIFLEPIVCIENYNDQQNMLYFLYTIAILNIYKTYKKFYSVEEFNFDHIFDVFSKSVFLFFLYLFGAIFMWLLNYSFFTSFIIFSFSFIHLNFIFIMFYDADLFMYPLKGFKEGLAGKTVLKVALAFAICLGFIGFFRNLNNLN